MAELLMKSANHQRGHSVRIRAAPLLIGTRPSGYRKNHLNHARDSWIAARQAFENQVVLDHRYAFARIHRSDVRWR